MFYTIICLQAKNIPFWMHLLCQHHASYLPLRYFLLSQLHQVVLLQCIWIYIHSICQYKCINGELCLYISSLYCQKSDLFTLHEFLVFNAGFSFFRMYCTSFIGINFCCVIQFLWIIRCLLICKTGKEFFF